MSRDETLDQKLAKLQQTIAAANAEKREQRETDRERVRSLLAEQAPEVLAWLDLVRGRFGPGVKLERLKCGDETFPKRNTTSQAAAALPATTKPRRGG